MTWLLHNQLEALLRFGPSPQFGILLDLSCISRTPSFFPKATELAIIEFHFRDSFICGISDFHSFVIIERGSIARWLRAHSSKTIY